MEPFSPDELKGDYCLEIEFKRGSPNPSRVFQAMSDLIETFQNIDRDLAASVASEIETNLVLEEIETGSVKTWLKSILSSVDDEALKAGEWKKVVGSYLLKGKRKIVEFLEKHDRIEKSAEVGELQDDLIKIAQETEVRRIPAYAPIPTRRLVTDLADIGKAVALLDKEDGAAVIDPEGRKEINKNFVIPDEVLAEIATHEVISNKNVMILQVKKPDYLGQSMWDFRHQGHPIVAKITDEAWLKRFQNREITVRPGDAIRALVETQIAYDRLGEAVESKYFIYEVYEVRTVSAWRQADLLPGTDEKKQ